MEQRAAEPEPQGADLLTPIRFPDITGWDKDDHRAAFAAFQAGASSILQMPPKARALGVEGHALGGAARAALREPAGIGKGAARRFFERYFAPRRINSPGFVTGYYEPEVAARRNRTEGFTVPLYRRPDDLVEVSDANRPAGWDGEVRFARRSPAGLAPYFDRSEIEAGALRGRGLEIAWLESAVDAFFIHVQGSARLRLPGGEVSRISFDGKSGHPYTSIGRLAVERGLLALRGADKDGLERWLKANPEAAARLMRENRSFIFFKESTLAPEEGPLGAAGIPLITGRSLAVDRTLHTFHSPVWVDAPALPAFDGPGPFRRLMIAHDTGSAIVGPARGDIFFGSGEAAGSQAGRVRHAAEMILLVPASAGDPE